MRVQREGRRKRQGAATADLATSLMDAGQDACIALECHQLPHTRAAVPRTGGAVRCRSRAAPRVVGHRVTVADNKGMGIEKLQE